MDTTPPVKSIEQIADEVGLYPVEAFAFVSAGLNHTTRKYFAEADANTPRHVTGQQLCLGLREFGQLLYGLMLPAVLAKWNIRYTYDFGVIVYAMIAAGRFSKSDDDTIDDFKSVFAIPGECATDYRIGAAAVAP